MKAIPWEDKKLTVRQQEILIGSLLGDGRIECRSLQGSARFRVHHADSQRELLFWKYDEFQDFVRREPWSTDWYDKRNSQWYRSWFFHTETSSIFAPPCKMFYVYKTKQVPNDIAAYLTPLAVAVWIADDGCGTPESLILNTQSFSLEEQKRLLDALEKRYMVQGTINRDRKNFRLRFNRANTNKLRLIVQSFDIPILKTKFLVPVTTNPSMLGLAMAAR